MGEENVRKIIIFIIVLVAACAPGATAVGQSENRIRNLLIEQVDLKMDRDGQSVGSFDIGNDHCIFVAEGAGGDSGSRIAIALTCKFGSG